MGKLMTPRPPPGVYRDEPDRDDAASTSSAVLLEDVGYPDADLPAYEDVAGIGLDRQNLVSVDDIQQYLTHPVLPASQLSQDKATTVTHWPEYSQDASALGEMLEEQANYPPIFTARLKGTHSETVHRKDKKETTTVIDFDIRLDMTHLVVPNSSTPENLKIQGLRHVFPQDKVHRGHRTKSVGPDDLEPGADDAIEGYISSPYPVRSFTLLRQILYHDSSALEKLLSSLVGSTNYRGHLQVLFPVSHNRVTVYRPCWQNQLRNKIWLRWIFYLTFLWIFSWPYLWFITRRWEVLVTQFPYSCSPDCGNRKFVVKSEKDFFEDWRSSLRRAVLGKRQGWIDEEYKRATKDALRLARSHQLNRAPSTGNALADGALGFLHHAVTVGNDVAMAGGWGADS